MDGLQRVTYTDQNGVVVYDSADTFPVYRNLEHAQCYTQQQHELTMKRYTENPPSLEEQEQAFRQLTEMP